MTRPFTEQVITQLRGEPVIRLAVRGDDGLISEIHVRPRYLTLNNDMLDLRTAEKFLVALTRAVEIMKEADQ